MRQLRQFTAQRPERTPAIKTAGRSRVACASDRGLQSFACLHRGPKFVARAAVAAIVGREVQG